MREAKRATHAGSEVEPETAWVVGRRSHDVLRAPVGAERGFASDGNVIAAAIARACDEWKQSHDARRLRRALLDLVLRLELVDA